MKIDIKEMKRLAKIESQKARHDPSTGFKNETWDSNRSNNGSRPLQKNIQMSQIATKINRMLKLDFDHETIKEKLEIEHRQLISLISRFRLPRPD
tara:strand:- start:323 stop:607 length:285 start_codon:yes stop_codon:yes gene_type:complete